MAVPQTHLLLAVRRAHPRIHVKHHAPWRTATRVNAFQRTLNHVLVKGITNQLLKFGIVQRPAPFEGQSRYDEITGCSPYGASTITRADGSRMPSENELAGARFQGRHVAQIAAKTSGDAPFK